MSGVQQPENQSAVLNANRGLVARLYSSKTSLKRSDVVSSKNQYRLIRKNLGWTQWEMAKYLGVNQSTVSGIEHGRTVKRATAYLYALLESGDAPNGMMANSPSGHQQALFEAAE